MAFKSREILEEFADASTKGREMFLREAGWRQHSEGLRHISVEWHRAELLRQREKYKREMMTPAGVERRRRWARETYYRTTSTEEGRERLRQQARETYYRLKQRPGWLEERNRRRRRNRP